MSKAYDVLNSIENGRVPFEEIMERGSCSDYEVQEIYGGGDGWGYFYETVYISKRLTIRSWVVTQW